MICSICNNDTSNVDFDYLVGDDHLACHLGVWAGHKAMRQKPKHMKIKNWDKISGYTYKGYCIVNPIHNADETKYSATVLDLNQPSKPQLELTVITNEHKFVQTGSKHFIVVLRDKATMITSQTSADKNTMASVATFRVIFESLTEEVQSAIAKHNLISAPKSHSYQSGGASAGIIKAVNASGTNIVVSGVGGQISQYNLIDTIKELQRLIDELKQNTPSNPF